MKKLLLLSALFLMGVTLFAKSAPSFTFDVSTAGTLEDKGEAVRTRDVMNKKGEKKGFAIYYDITGEWKTVKFTLAADKASISMRSSKDGRYECKSLKINDEEKLTEPIIVERSKEKKPEKFKAKSSTGKIVVVAEIRAAEK